MRSWKYDIVHELCHAILGYGCCREHDEYAAHGAAKVLCKMLEIDIGDADERMNYYAGRTAIRKGACTGFNRVEEERKKEVKELKKNGKQKQN